MCTFQQFLRGGTLISRITLYIRCVIRNLSCFVIHIFTRGGVCIQICGFSISLRGLFWSITVFGQLRSILHKMCTFLKLQRVTVCTKYVYLITQIIRVCVIFLLRLHPLGLPVYQNPIREGAVLTPPPPGGRVEAGKRGFHVATHHFT